MFRAILFVAISIAASHWVTHAQASSSLWESFAGGRVGLITAGAPAADGTIRGALVVDLAPGWKTYWRDPGDAGVPPSITLPAGSTYRLREIGFPAPERIDDGSTKWAGYKHAVAFPLMFDAQDATGTLKADVFLGVCETICIPVQATLAVDPAADPDNADDLAQVDAAFSALPQPAGPGFGATVADERDGVLVVTAEIPGDPDKADLFVASPEGFVLGTPERMNAAGPLTFSIAIIDAPVEREKDTAIPYTLVGEDGAASGTLRMH